MVVNELIKEAYPSFIGELNQVAKNSSSPAEIESWLNALKFVLSVKMQPYHIKTEPPQLEYVVEFRMPDDSKITKVIDISLSSPMKVCGMHDS